MRSVLTVALAAGCWAVWGYFPVLLGALGLAELDIPGRVCGVFLFLTLAEGVAGWFR
jgi:hypothetical protein